jgi:diguanylate cyclase (GGDEF)-like protein/PAS domain S-box-containing protein
MSRPDQRAVPRLQHTDLSRARLIEGREWWLWGFAVTITLALTAGIVFLTLGGQHAELKLPYSTDPREWVRALAAFVLLFDIYTLYQHLQLQRVRRQLAERDHLFQLISENAADMIAVVDSDGNRLYNSPAYQKILGYSPDELSTRSSFDQIHASDRERVIQASAKAFATGQTQRLEYRIRHNDGTWRVLESTASAVRGDGGEVRELVIVNRDITERKRAEEMLEHNAFYDGLTDLPNRALFADRLQRALVHVQRHVDSKFSVLFVDIDEFKVINDSLGHPAGDELLLQIAKRLTRNFRDTDTLARPGSSAQPLEDGLARLGGDEFAVLLEDVRNPSDAIRVAQRIQSKLALPFEIRGQQIVITASIGVASSATSYSMAEELLRDAEIAMYRAKRAGKARCEVFDPTMHSTALVRLKLETDLRRGLENGELIAYYQPIISLITGKIAGFEALSRWRRPEGIVPPAEFIPLADETGLIQPINRLMMREACHQLRTWQSQFRCDPPLTMSVNVSPRQFAEPELSNEISLVLKETGVSPSTLNLEITETIAMSDADRALFVLSEIKALGVGLSVDDFGTGYSSLSRLPRFPVDALKIDRVFISDMSTNRDNHEIVRLIINLAHNIGLKVVAEGTEKEDQINELRRLGCEMAQGFLYSPPVSAEAAFGLLMRNYEGSFAR